MEILPHEKKIYEYIESIEHLKEKNQDNGLFQDEIHKFEKKLKTLKKKVYGNLSAWERVTICRHPDRPHSIDYIQHLCDSFHELAGDRVYGDDPAVVGGLATIGEMTCVILGQEKGNDTESRMARNFGMLHPEGFRKALRLMRLAEKFHLPVVNLLDTPGAYPGLEAEERGQGCAIAINLREMIRIATPIIVVIIGEGCSGGALGMGIGDVVAMLEHSYYSVITPEGCASILWKDTVKNVEAASALKLTAEDLHEFKIVDAILQEPLGGAHHDPKEMVVTVKEFILKEWNVLRRIDQTVLLKRRYGKFREMGEVKIKS